MNMKMKKWMALSVLLLGSMEVGAAARVAVPRALTEQEIRGLFLQDDLDDALARINYGHPLADGALREMCDFGIVRRKRLSDVVLVYYEKLKTREPEVYERFLDNIRNFIRLDGDYFFKQLADAERDQEEFSLCSREREKELSARIIANSVARKLKAADVLSRAQRPGDDEPVVAVPFDEARQVTETLQKSIKDILKASGRINGDSKSTMAAAVRNLTEQERDVLKALAMLTLP